MCTPNFVFKMKPKPSLSRTLSGGIARDGRERPSQKQLLLAEVLTLPFGFGFFFFFLGLGFRVQGLGCYCRLKASLGGSWAVASRVYKSSIFLLAADGFRALGSRVQELVSGCSAFSGFASWAKFRNLRLTPIPQPP